MIAVPPELPADAGISLPVTAAAVTPYFFSEAPLRNETNARPLPALTRRRLSERPHADDFPSSRFKRMGEIYHVPAKKSIE